ncbi:hypothetical protein DFS33DRAFT_916218 [Desarmillaria ectypa]|nr:hypothetical protein DFS33DRAFT_916218 [Desarmillaria ectypa]
MSIFSIILFFCPHIWLRLEYPHNLRVISASHSTMPRTTSSTPCSLLIARPYNWIDWALRAHKRGIRGSHLYPDTMLERTVGFIKIIWTSTHTHGVQSHDTGCVTALFGSP